MSGARRPRRVLVGVEPLADELGVSVRFVRRLVSERRIPYYKVGRLLRFDLTEVEEWLDDRHVEAWR